MKKKTEIRPAEEILKECTGHAYGLTSAIHIKAMKMYAEQFIIKASTIAEFLDPSAEHVILKLKEELK